MNVVRRRLDLIRDERGIALLMAVGSLFVLAIMATTVLELSSAGGRSTRHSDATQKALSIAEAAMNEGVAALATNPTIFTGLPTTVSDYAPASASYSGALLSGSVWRITGTATVPSGNDGISVTRTVSQNVQVVASALAGNEAWNYVFANAPGCTYIPNTVVVNAPIYTKGDLCIKNAGRLTGSRVDVYGSIQIENENENLPLGKIGDGTNGSDLTDPAVGTRLGCRIGSSGALSLACLDSTYKVYRSSFSNTVEGLTKPPFDPSKRSTANLGPLSGCTTSTGTVPSFSSTGEINLTPSTSYTCRKLNALGLPVAELSWNSILKNLTVLGTIWFDGQLMLDSAAFLPGTYDGKATIYFAGKITIKNAVELCAVPTCSTTAWNPNLELLVLVTGASDIPAFVVDNAAKFQGAGFAVGGFKIQNGATFQGPVIADVIDTQNNGFTAGWPPLTSLLDGMPQNPTAPTVSLVGNSWRG